MKGRIETWTPALAALAPTLLLTPHALRIADAVAGSRRTLFALLLLQVSYTLVGAVCLGAGSSTRFVPRTGGLLVPMVASCLAVLLFADVDLAALALAQPAILGSLILGWGVGRAARGLCGRRGSAFGMALLVITAFAVGVLPLSHAAPLFETWPEAGEALLATNPYVAVTNAAAFDLIRSPPLYDSLTLSDYRFTYPRPWLPPLLLSGIGLGVGLLGIGVERRPRKMSSHSSMREVTP